MGGNVGGGDVGGGSVGVIGAAVTGGDNVGDTVGFSVGLAVGLGVGILATSSMYRLQNWSSPMFIMSLFVCPVWFSSLSARFLFLGLTISCCRL